jgi:hypothetical protein
MVLDILSRIFYVININGMPQKSGALEFFENLSHARVVGFVVLEEKWVHAKISEGIKTYHKLQGVPANKSTLFCSLFFFDRKRVYLNN